MDDSENHAGTSTKRFLSLKVLVLGASSFAAGYVIRQLLSSDYRVCCISRSEISELFSPFSADELSSLVDFHKAHIVDDNEFVLAKLINFRPNVIIDFAGQGMVAPSWDHPWQWFETNLVAKSRIIRRLVNVDWLDKYIRVSTPEVYGSREVPIQPGTSHNPSTPYAVSHSAVDQFLMTCFKNYDFPVVIPRYANFYGEYQKLYRVVPRALWSAMTGESFVLDGGGFSERLFIHGQDVASSIEAIILRGNAGAEYHFSGDVVISIKDLVGLCFDSMGLYSFDDVVELGPDRVGKDKKYVLDDELTRSSLGWSPTVSLSSGIARCCNWVLENRLSLALTTKEYEHTR